jgi:4-hydroxy-2-oxoheptanedioate aldolase
VRAADYGQAGSLRHYVEEANRETLIVVHLETADGIANLPEILEVEGIDVVFIGPTDLSHSLGLPGRSGEPQVQAAMNRIARLVHESGRYLGLMVGSVEAAREWSNRGAVYITIGLEALLAQAAKTYLAGAGWKG